jgi:hypothetical protein
MLEAMTIHFYECRNEAICKRRAIDITPRSCPSESNSRQCACPADSGTTAAASAQQRRVGHRVLKHDSRDGLGLHIAKPGSIDRFEAAVAHGSRLTVRETMTLQQTESRTARGLPQAMR